MANKNKFTGLEIEGNYVKLAQAVDSLGLRKVVRLIVKKLASQSEKEIIAALKDTLGELKGQNRGHLTICIPRHKVTVRFLRFPTVNEKEITAMVGLQSVQELPFAKEEIIIDYLVTERTKDGYVKVALVIVHRDVINHYLNILKKAGLEPERITFSTEAILHWHQATLGQKGSSGCSVLIDLDSDNAEIVILANSHLGFTRGLTWGIEQMQSQPDLGKKLADEIRRTIQAYSRQEHSEQVEKVILSQTKETAQTLKAILEQELNLPCQTADPLENLPYQKEITVTQYQPQPSLLRVLGTVLDTHSRKLNLLPVNLREKQTIRLKKKRTSTAIILLSGIILLGTLIFVKKIHDKQLYISYLNREIAKMAPLAKEVEEMLKNIELIEKRRKIAGSSVDILRELHNLTPQNILLASFNYDEEKQIVALQGNSTDMSEIFKFINTLERSGYFKNVQLKYVSEKKAKADGLTDFKMECSLE